MKAPNNQNKYTNIITSLVNNAITQTEGIAPNEVFRAKQNKFFRSHNVTVIFEDNIITIDVYINVVFGYNVAQVSCALQEKIIKDVKANTELTIKKVNIIVDSVIFS